MPSYNIINTSFRDKMSNFELKMSRFEMIEIRKIGLDAENLNTLECLMLRLQVERQELREIREIQDLREIENKKQLAIDFTNCIVSSVRINTLIIIDVVINMAIYTWLLLRMLYTLMSMGYALTQTLYALSKATWNITTTFIGAVINVIQYIRLLLPQPDDCDDTYWGHTLIEDCVTNMILTNTNEICKHEPEPEIFYEQIPIIDSLNTKLPVYDVVFPKLEIKYSINIQTEVVLKMPEECVNSRQQRKRLRNKQNRKQVRKNISLAL